jgi:hypothetical protein
MILTIFLGAPLWVWPLLAFLIGYGIRASRKRSTSVLAVYLIPLLGFITLRAIISISGGATIWGAYVAFYAIGAAIGYQIQKKWLLEKNGKQVTLAGEWVTIVVVMTLFWMNFVFGVMQVISPDLLGQMWFIIGYSAIVGLASGSLLGRAILVFRSPKTTGSTRDTQLKGVPT